jgi:predicted transporter
MDLNIILWLGGMLFSLGIFAVKVGFGIAFGRLSRRQISFILGGYLSLFAAVAILSNSFLELAGPILKSGMYIHIAMSAGLALWGLALLFSGSKIKEGRYSVNSKLKIQESKDIIIKSKSEPRYLKFKIQDSKPQIQNAELKIQNSKLVVQNSEDMIANGKSNPRYLKFRIPQSLLLIIPCPVCITAIGISVSSALTVLKAPPLIVGLAMGLFFVIFAAGLAFILKPKEQDSADISLGLSMLGIALYFAGSLFIPRKIEEARLAYQSFSSSSSIIDTTQSTGVLVLFLVVFALGFLIYRDNEDIS